MNRTIITAALGLTLAGCATTPIDSRTAGPYPDDYQAVVADYVQHAFKDPGSVRGAALSDPVPGRIFSEVGWFTCLSANARNGFGGYTGEQTTALIIRGGHVVSTADGALGGMCLGRRTYPAPGIDGHG